MDAAGRRPPYPPTPEEPVTEVLHGTEVTDPYRWLEAADDPAVQSWVAAQNQLTDRLLRETPVVRTLTRRLGEVMGGSQVSRPVLRGGQLFFLRREAGANQPVLCVRPESAAGTSPHTGAAAGAHAGERVLLDPNALNAAGTTALDWWVPSPDGRRVAFGLSENGDEWSVLHVLDVEHGELLAERIPRTRYASVAWEPDGSGFFYTRYPQPGEVSPGDESYYRRLYYHRLGTDYRRDPLVFGEGRPRREMVQATLSEDGRYLLLLAHQGWSRTEVYLLDRTSPDRGFQPVIEKQDARFEGQIVAGTLYLLTNHRAPRYRIVAVSAVNPRPDQWWEVVPEQRDRVLMDFAVVGGRLVLTGLRDAAYRLWLRDLPAVDRPDPGDRVLAGAAAGGTGEREIPLPGPGLVSSLTGQPGGTRAYFTFESFLTAPTIYRLDLQEERLSLWAQSETGLDPDRIQVQQVFYTSRDGTRVPMFILHRRDLRPDGRRPTVLTGYGGFHVSRTPEYMPAIGPWLEQGGVWALANLRGGGEYGEEWHRAGMLDRKQNVFDDFLAAAEYLTAAGYTRPERLGIFGRSNGGLLVGAALTQRPDLFRAVVCGVPLLDMIRYHRFLLGALWTSEYGSPEEPEAFNWLYAYSPYHRVQQGVPYPAVYFYTATSDTRVAPLHAWKMAARLQAATASEHPILLRTEFAAGHGVGKPLHKKVAEEAEIWGFLAQQLGLSLEPEDLGR